jgi:hypothetical protein
MSPTTAASLVATCAVLLGFTDLPYGYYMLLRLFLCGVSLFFMFGAHLALADWQRWILGGLAVLYNPIFPVRIGERAIWQIVNVATVGLLWHLSRARTRPSWRGASE